MAGVQTTNTMSERLQKMLRDLADMRLADDADPDYLDALRDVIEQRLKAPVEAQLQQAGIGGQPGVGGGPMGMDPFGPSPMPPAADMPIMGAALAGGAQGASSGLGMMPGPPTAPGMGHGVGNLRMNPTMPNPDELRRMLAGNMS